MIYSPQFPMHHWCFGTQTGNVENTVWKYYQVNTQLFNPPLFFFYMKSDSWTKNRCFTRGQVQGGATNPSFPPPYQCAVYNPTLSLFSQQSLRAIGDPCISKWPAIIGCQNLQWFTIHNISTTPVAQRLKMGRWKVNGKWRGLLMHQK